MTEAFLSHSLSCMLVNHGLSQQSCREEYEPWKWGATARYYTSHTKTMLPTRKYVPRSSRQLSHEDLLTIIKPNWSGMDMSPVHQVWSKPSCKAQWKGEEDEADRRSSGETTSENRQAWSLLSPRGAEENRKTKETGCGVICGAPTTIAVKG